MGKNNGKKSIVLNNGKEQWKKVHCIEFSQQVWSVVVLDTNRLQYALHINYLYVLFYD
jgi:hypothetical protein